MTHLNDCDSLLRHSHNQHLVLLYDDEIERSSAEIDCINHALNKDGYCCLYATIDANEMDFVSKKVAPRIMNYDVHVKDGNLDVINFKPFYNAAAIGDFTPFRQLKARIEETLRNRIELGKGGKALLVADAACHLSRNKQLTECVTLEKWW